MKRIEEEMKLRDCMLPCRYCGIAGRRCDREYHMFSVGCCSRCYHAK